MKRLFSFSFVVLLGLAFVIPSTSSWSAGTLKVTTPNGGNKWKTGKKYAIKWVKGNAGGTVKIQLLKSGKHYKWVSKKTKNDGKHPWKVPASVATGSAYKIKIVSTKNNKVFDKSNKNFTITKTSDDADSIVVTTPNASQSWTAGKTYMIKWKKGNAGASVKIYLTKSGKHYKWISKKTTNDGKHQWQIPTTVAAGSAYKIKIVSTKNKRIFDSSNRYFTIKKMPIKVTSPNGGELWKTGETYTIRWNKGDGGGNVKIELMESGKVDRVIVRSTINDGLYSWNVSVYVSTGSTYKVKITRTTDKNIYDLSDKHFKVTNDEGGFGWEPPLTGVWVGAWGSKGSCLNAVCDGSGLKATLTETADHLVFGTFRLYGWPELKDGTFSGTRSAPAGANIDGTAYGDVCTFSFLATKVTYEERIAGSIWGNYLDDCADDFAYFYLRKME